jgi:hypothetical protein
MLKAFDLWACGNLSVSPGTSPLTDLGVSQLFNQVINVVLAGEVFRRNDAKMFIWNMY